MTEQLWDNMVPKKVLIVAVVVGVVVTVVAVAGVYFLMSALKPPVDISGINLSPTLTTEEVLPAMLVNKPLDEETVYTRERVGTTDSLEFTVLQTSVEYDGITVHVVKAGSEFYASKALDIFYEGYNEGTRTKTSDWFTFEGAGISVFFWKSDRWVFGVEAENSVTRNQAASELVQELKGS